MPDSTHQIRMNVHILVRFFIRTSIMVALVYVYNLLSALNEQLTIFLCSPLFSLRFEKCESSEF